MKKKLSRTTINKIKCELASRDFYEFCKLKAPEFYNVDYLKEICIAMQEFLTDDNELLVINLPPRHGKSRTVNNFVQWALGNNNNLKIISASYNEKLSQMFSKIARDSITEEKADVNRLIYSDIFPTTKIERGASRIDLWKLVKSPEYNYLATSPTSTMTGFGGNIGIIDDLIKNSYEANHAGIMEDQFLWFTNTFYSRLEGMSKLLLIATRWATKDLTGRLINMYSEQGRKFRLITKKAFDGSKMLNENILSYDRYQNLIQTIGEDIVRANYDQEPIDLKGALYGTFRTYTQHPAFTSVEAMCDTADRGKDYLCNIIYGVVRGRPSLAYVLDVYYTKDNMDITEIELSRRLTEFQVNKSTFESNFGGVAFKKVIQRLCKEAGNTSTKFVTYTQTKNKEARILSNSSNVIRRIFMPEQWNKLYPEFYQHVTEYQREGTNQIDDGLDALSAICEHLKDVREGLL